MTKTTILFLSSITVLGVLCNSTKSTSSKLDYGIPPKVTEIQKASVDEGAIGDVKYSILKPELFFEANGNGWVLMKGQPFSEVNPDVLIMQEQEYFNINGVPKLPDARGLFLRAMNEGREKDDNNGDPKTDRIVGEFQPDLIRDHDHNYLKYTDHGWTASYGKPQSLVKKTDFENNHATAGVNEKKRRARNKAKKYKLICLCKSEKV